MATTVLPVPAPPSTLAGPLNFLATSFSWLGCRKTRHFSSGASRMAVKSLSDWIVTNRRRESGCSRAVAKSVGVHLVFLLAWRPPPALLRAAIPSASQISASAHSAGRCLFRASRSSGCPHGPHRWQQDGRHAEGEQQVVVEWSSRPAAFFLRRRHDGLFGLADVEDLQGPRDRVDLEGPVLGPVHRLVVVVHPDEDVHIALGRGAG